jgi:hypothetical protein
VKEKEAEMVAALEKKSIESDQVSNAIIFFSFSKSSPIFLDRSFFDQQMFVHKYKYFFFFNLPQKCDDLLRAADCQFQILSDEFTREKSRMVQDYSSRISQVSAINLFSSAQTLRLNKLACLFSAQYLYAMIVTEFTSKVSHSARLSSLKSEICG